MNKNFTTLFFLVTISFFSLAQNCQQEFHDYYSDSTLWTHIGSTNNVIVSSGICQFNDAYCDHYDKILRQLPFTLSDNYWKAELKFSITAPNAFGYGVGANLFAATADTLDVWSYDASGGYSLTNQDEISLALSTVTIDDNNIDHWQFISYSKKGTVLVPGTSIIYADSTIKAYYLRLERFAIDSIRLSIFSDTAFTSHLPGSPVSSAIDPSITGLNYIQQGVATWGYSTRHLTGIIDSLNICNSVPAGTEEAENQKSFFLYPNPADNTLKLSLTNLPSSISIYNYFGQKIYESTAEINPTIDVTAFSNGLYLLHTKIKNDLIENKFIVHH